MNNEMTPGPDGTVAVGLELRWSDQDALGHVNNARIITLMEEARIRWTRGGEAKGRFGFGTVVASLQVDYLRQLHYGPDFSIRLGIVRIGTKSFTVRHVGIQGGVEVFDGTTVMVPLAEDGVSSRALDPEERAWLEGSMTAARARA
jgi:acyl-CoA thioester hydrolase